jgi:cytochrome oxidase assembly protein ShyY1
VVVAVAVVVMVNLSVWQLNRLHERRDTNAEIAARANEPVVPVDSASLDGLTPDELRYRFVTAEGTYVTDGPGGGDVLIANQTVGGAPGWWVVTPLRTGSGLVVLVNRGWVPFASAVPGESLDAFAPPAGPVYVEGLLQTTQSAVVGAEDDAMALPRLDVELLASRIGGEVAPVWLQLEVQDPAQPNGEPIPVTLPPLDDGPHLNYTGQWAIFATLTLVIYLVLVIRTAQRGGDGPGTARRASRALDTDPDLAVMCALRLAPLVEVDRLRVVTDLPPGVIDTHIAALVAGGLARRHDVAPTGWTLTPEGHTALEERLRAQLDAAGLRTAVTALYERFCALNPDVLAVVTDWQVVTSDDGTMVINDHTDAVRDAAVVARLGALGDAAGPLCDDLGALVARFGNYRHRLEVARRHVESWEYRWVDSPLIDSFHTVWFELHEHLLATLGIERGRPDPATPGVATGAGDG